MDTINHQEFVKQAEKSYVLIGIEPAGARKFFTDTDHATIKEKVGKSLFIKRLFVKTYIQYDLA